MKHEIGQVNKEEKNQNWHRIQGAVVCLIFIETEQKHASYPYHCLLFLFN